MSHLPTLTIGLDLGDRFSQFCVLDANGVVVEEGRVATSAAGFRLKFGKLEHCRIALEVGTHSPWSSRLLADLGHEVLVANARKLRMIYQNENKSDLVDAKMLAKVARFDPDLLAPIQHRGISAQASLAIIRARAGIVASRTQLVQMVRGLCKSMGHRLPSCTTEGFAKKVRELVPAELVPAIGPTLDMIERLTETIGGYNKQIKAGADAHPGAANLMSVYSVGPITALTFALVIEDPRRFRHSRSVASYLGLRPGRSQSGKSDPELRITKTGDGYLRSLLVECAQRTLCPKGRDSDLRRWGLSLAGRGRKSAKKRAVVAVARKLAVILHAMWLNDKPYCPFRPGSQAHAPTEFPAAAASTA